MSDEIILITGASGAIASILRKELKHKKLILMSRNKILNLKSNEVSIICDNLLNNEWWHPVRSYKKFERIFHLSEIVKKKNINVKKISKSHINFLNWACENSKKVVYPLTAYIYDDLRKNDPYVIVKKRVFKECIGKKNLCLPIIHPLVDYGNGLNKIVLIVNKISIFNYFSSFDSKLYVLKLSDLINHFRFDLKTGLYDLYTSRSKVSEVFNSQNRINLNLISYFLKIIFSFFKNYSLINTLLYGRDISHDKII